METPGEAQNVTMTSSRAPKCFLVTPQLFNTPSFSMFIVTTFRKMQKHLRLLVALAKLVGEVLVVLHATIVDKTTMEEGNMRAE